MKKHPIIFTTLITALLLIMVSVINEYGVFGIWLAPFLILFLFSIIYITE